MDMRVKDKFLQRAGELTPADCFRKEGPNYDIRSTPSGNTSGSWKDKVVVKVDLNLPVRCSIEQ